jgi:hypothetical protein
MASEIVTEEQRDEIIVELKGVNEKLRVQNSYLHMFVVGIVYGIGFVVGSAVIATILLGALGPWIGQIPWVRTAFEAGVQLLGK